MRDFLRDQQKNVVATVAKSDNCVASIERREIAYNFKHTPGQGGMPKITKKNENTKITNNTKRNETQNLNCSLAVFWN